jgi:hypothetical protein
MGNNGINYTSRNFVDIRTDLVNMVKQYYPDILVILTMRQLV